MAGRHVLHAQRFLFFSNFPSLADWEGLILLQDVAIHTYSHSCMQSGGGFVGIVPATPLTGREKKKSEPPCAVNTWPIWWRGCKSTTPFLLALHQSLKSGCFPVAVRLWERESEPLFAFQGSKDFIYSLVSVGCLVKLNWRCSNSSLNPGNKGGQDRNLDGEEEEKMCFSDLYMYLSMGLFHSYQTATFVWARQWIGHLLV